MHEMLLTEPLLSKFVVPETSEVLQFVPLYTETKGIRGASIPCSGVSCDPLRTQNDVVRHFTCLIEASCPTFFVVSCEL